MQKCIKCGKQHEAALPCLTVDKAARNYVKPEEVIDFLESHGNVGFSPAVRMLVACAYFEGARAAFKAETDDLRRLIVDNAHMLAQLETQK